MNVIGVDLGTSRVKAVRFDENWRAVAAADEVTTVAHPSSGWSEQDMDEVWAAAVRVISAVTGRGEAPRGTGRDAVGLIAVTGQGDGCWLVDAGGRPVRPAMLWNDARSQPVVDAWERDGTLAAAFAVTGCYGSSGVAHAELRWLAEHEPDVLDRADAVLSCGSWVFQQLSGRRVLDVSEAVNPFLDSRTGTYDDALLDAYGLRAQARLLPPVVGGGDRAGTLTPDAADAVGLPAGTPVVLAPYDLITTATGSGVARPGQAFAVLGTTLCVGVLTTDPELDRAPNGLTLPTGQGGSWLVAYPTMCGTEVLDWAAKLLAVDGPPALIELAAQARPSADGSASVAGGRTRGTAPLVVPYFSPGGERAPFRDSSARGALLNLTTETSPADVARATVDGLTLAVLDCFLACGGADVLSVAGGGARSELWCQAICDAVGVPVQRTDSAEAGALGAALTGAAEIDVIADLPAAVEQAVGLDRRYEPDDSRNGYYRKQLGELTRVRAVM